MILPSSKYLTEFFTYELNPYIWLILNLAFGDSFYTSWGRLLKVEYGLFLISVLSKFSDWICYSSFVYIEYCSLSMIILHFIIDFVLPPIEIIWLENGWNFKFVIAQECARYLCDWNPSFIIQKILNCTEMKTVLKNRIYLQDIPGSKLNPHKLSHSHLSILSNNLKFNFDNL